MYMLYTSYIIEVCNLHQVQDDNLMTHQLTLDLTERSLKKQMVIHLDFKCGH